MYSNRLIQLRAFLPTPTGRLLLICDKLLTSLTIVSVVTKMIFQGWHKGWLPLFFQINNRHRHLTICHWRFVRQEVKEKGGKKQFHWQRGKPEKNQKWNRKVENILEDSTQPGGEENRHANLKRARAPANFYYLTFYTFKVILCSSQDFKGKKV